MTLSRPADPRTPSGPASTAPPRRATPLARIAVCTPLAIVVLLALDWCLALVRPATREQVWLFWTAVWATPIWLTGALLMVVWPTTVLIGRRVRARPIVVDGILVALFGLYCFGTRISPPTGDQLGWWKGAATSTIAGSETLADLVHKVPYWMTQDLNSVRLVSPVFGVVAIAAYLALARRLALTTDIDRDLLRVFAIATPLPFWFVAGYIENTFLGLPFLLLGLERIVLLLQRPRIATALQAALLTGLATAVHLLFLVTAVGVAIALLIIGGRRATARLRDAALVLGASLAVPALAIGVLLLTPLEVFPGNTNGGYDKQLLTPWVLHPGDWPNRFTMISHAHLIEVANIVVQVAPTLVLALPVLLITARRGGAGTGAGLQITPVLVLMGVLSVGYLAFIAVFGFDYGPVGDLDLMLVLSVPLSFLVLLVAAQVLRRRPGVLVGLVLSSVLLQFAYYTLKVTTAWAA